jgi:hypothetical protein
MFLAMNSWAQFKIDAELRPQYEYRNGVKTLFPDNADYASFVSQRTRINTSFTKEKFGVFISLQNVRIWGDVPQLNKGDKNGTGLHQAYGELFLTSNLTIKLGRQEVVYNDARIMGNVDWAVQGRSHDMALMKYQKNKFKLEVGVAVNQDSDSLTGRTYLQAGNYKNLQLLWMDKTWNKFSTSFLFLNNGLQYINQLDVSKNEVRYSQTAGFHLNYKAEKIKWNSNIFYQFGEDLNGYNLSAYLLGLEGSYQLTSKVNATIGGEIQSGNNEGAVTGRTNKAFNPLYGTNHKFNGYMDYFYVGNHLNNVGLIDGYLKSDFKVKEKSKIGVAIHQFFSPSEIKTESLQPLATELDILYTYTYDKDLSIKVGYSQLFAQDGIEFIKSTKGDNVNNFAYVIVTFKPNLFTHNTK